MDLKNKRNLLIRITNSPAALASRRPALARRFPGRPVPLFFPGKAGAGEEVKRETRAGSIVLPRRPIKRGGRLLFLFNSKLVRVEMPPFRFGVYLAEIGANLL